MVAFAATPKLVWLCMVKNKFQQIESLLFQLLFSLQEAIYMKCSISHEASMNKLSGAWIAERLKETLKFIMYVTEFSLSPFSNL